MIENNTILLAAILFGVAAYLAIKWGVQQGLRAALDERYLKPRAEHAEPSNDCDGSDCKVLGREGADRDNRSVR